MTVPNDDIAGHNLELLLAEREQLLSANRKLIEEMKTYSVGLDPTQVIQLRLETLIDQLVGTEDPPTVDRIRFELVFDKRMGEALAQMLPKIRADRTRNALLLDVPGVTMPAPDIISPH